MVQGSFHDAAAEGPKHRVDKEAAKRFVKHSLSSIPQPASGEDRKSKKSKKSKSEN